MFESATAKHTAGPWKAILSDLVPKFWAIESESGDVGYLTLQPYQIEANARLIAAAPDLLAALLDLAPSDIPNHPMPEYHAARAAIAKATGDAQ